MPVFPIHAVRLIPVAPAAASCVFPSNSFHLSNLICASVAMGPAGPTPPRPAAITTGAGYANCRQAAEAIVADHRPSWTFSVPVPGLQPPGKFASVSFPPGHTGHD
jgi:hypothetical protein